MAARMQLSTLPTPINIKVSKTWLLYQMTRDTKGLLRVEFCLFRQLEISYTNGRFVAASDDGVFANCKIQ